jgi:hypothetical protein
MNIDQLNEIIEESGFDKIGLRVMTGGKIVSEGERLENSFVWVDGNCTNEQLEGVSALDLEFDGWEIEEDRLNEMLEIAKTYNLLSDSEQVVIVGGNDGYEGNDQDEIVIYDAHCVAVLG